MGWDMGTPIVMNTQYILVTTSLLDRCINNHLIHCNSPLFLLCVCIMCTRDCVVGTHGNNPVTMSLSIAMSCITSHFNKERFIQSVGGTFPPPAPHCWTMN